MIRITYKLDVEGVLIHMRYMTPFFFVAKKKSTCTKELHSAALSARDQQDTATGAGTRVQTDKAARPCRRMISCSN